MTKSSKKTSEATTKFGPYVDSNDNYVRLRETMVEFVKEQLELGSEDVLWGKPSDFSKVYGFTAIDTTDFRNAFNKTKEVVKG